MLLTCFIKKIKDTIEPPKQSRLARMLFPATRSHPLSEDNDYCTLEFNMSSHQCFLKHGHQWKNIAEYHSFIVDTYNVQCELKTMNQTYEQRVHNKNLFEQSFKEDSRQNDTLAFLYHVRAFDSEKKYIPFMHAQSQSSDVVDANTSSNRLFFDGTDKTQLAPSDFKYLLKKDPAL